MAATTRPTSSSADQTDAPQLISYHAEKTIKNQTFIISTDRSLLSSEFINTAFASDEMSWAKPLSPDRMRTMLAMSTVLGLYRTTTTTTTAPPARTMPASATPPEPRTLEMVGMARFIADHVTFAWLTDVYIIPGARGLGLGTWLTQACNGWLAEVPVLRGCVLLTDSVAAMTLYERHLGMSVLESGREGLVGEGRMVAMRNRKDLKAE